MQDIDYAEMLEIPVSTVTVTKKKSLFRRREQPRQDDLKERVVDSVNERMGAAVEAEDISEPPKIKSRAEKITGKGGSIVLVSEIAAVCLIALAIFLTNIFMPNSAINTFISSIVNPVQTSEPTYSQFTLTPVVSASSNADIVVSDDGVMSFMEEGAVYPVCDGVIQTVAETNGTYMVKIAHTSTFSSVITGLTGVYAANGDYVRANLPFAYSDGAAEVSVCLYDGDALLNCYTLTGVLPVWKS